MNDLRIALIQSDLHWENVDANLAMFEEKIWQISAASDLILLPEMFTTGFSMNPEKLAEPINSKTFRWMKQQSAQSKAVIAGSYIAREGNHFYNRFYAVFPDGLSKHYDKRHLFGIAGEGKSYTGGTHRMIFELKGWKIMPLICYDLRFPVWSRSRKKDTLHYEYDLLLYMANWPKPRIRAWDTLLAARAIENTAYCAGVNRLGVDGADAEYTGHSAIYDYKGEQMCFSEKEEILEVTLSQDDLRSFRDRFPFQKDADEFRLD